MKKRIVLCADDYGQAPHISNGIIELIQQNRLSATSCMVNAPSWSEASNQLIPFKNKIDIGLHFNLTEGEALSNAYVTAHGKALFPLKTLLRKAMLRRLNQAAIEAECHAQIDRFADSLGFLPHFIDGHQHVHQFPVIRDALIKVYEKRLRVQQVYVRWVSESIMSGGIIDRCKKLIIYATGTRALQQLLNQHHIPYNHSFSGIYSFSQAAHYASLFPQFLKEINDGGLIMCHPGLKSVQMTTDAIAEARSWELKYFISQQFLKDCQRHEIEIGRFA